jgi:uroporphyrinogen decarboxylase
VLGSPAMLRDTGASVIGVDWRVDLDVAWERLGYDVAIQGNLDPVVLFADRDEIERQAVAILEQAAGRPGHIFNVGHGILPETPLDNVASLIDVVHRWRR